MSLTITSVNAAVPILTSHLEASATDVALHDQLEIQVVVEVGQEVAVAVGEGVVMLAEEDVVLVDHRDCLAQMIGIVPCTWQCV